MRSGLVRILLPAGLAVALVGTAACGSSNNNGNTAANSGTTNSAAPVASVVSSPAAGVSVTKPAGTVAAPSAGSPAAAATALTEVATDNKFSETKYTVKAGVPATLTIENHGQAIHNWHLLDMKDDSGKEIKTDLTNGGKSSSVTFTISKPGTYNFHCDVHPTEMTGTLVVQ
ncbi:MAG TPA: cupredoxin domain-containing protein [Dehalococcoidia bacterium]|nr:cupredoxin domain-containing protein [Dehalococcoidia bacterium]